jgi:predicted transporter
MMATLPSRGNAMLRWLLLGLLLMGLGIGIQRGWLVVNHQKFSDDLRLQFLEDPQAVRRLRFLFGGGP